MAATRATACVRRRRCCSPSLAASPPLPPGPGDRKGRAGSARPAAPSPCSRGPEVPRPRAHPTALLVGCGAGLFGAGEQGTWCSDLLCASGRGHLSGSARTRRRDAQGRVAPDARPPPPSRQSRGLSAIDRFPESAVPFLFPPFCPNAGGETPGYPGEGASGLQGSLSPGSPLPCRPVPPAPGWSSPSYRPWNHRDCSLILPAIKSGK
jgi:hypothetical protein